MGKQPQHFVLYTCDECGLEVESEGMDGMSPVYPMGWLGIMNAPTSGDIFCSWKCLGSYATRNAVERATAADQRKTEREALKAQVTADGGTV
jgi:hypothetical protein